MVDYLTSGHLSTGDGQARHVESLCIHQSLKGHGEILHIKLLQSLYYMLSLNQMMSMVLFAYVSNLTLNYISQIQNMFKLQPKSYIPFFQIEISQDVLKLKIIALTYLESLTFLDMFAKSIIP